jgi:hypothetical protein
LPQFEQLRVLDDDRVRNSSKDRSRAIDLSVLQPFVRDLPEDVSRKPRIARGS